MSKTDLVREQVESNVSALGYHDAFQGHRERLTTLLLAAAPANKNGSLCVLGAGNCFDLDLPRLAESYSEIHLVDIDAASLTRTITRSEPEVRPKLYPHAPVDLSGMLDRLERWSRLEVTPDELLRHGALTALGVRKQLGRSFDVVASACVLSQMQLAAVQGLGETHQLLPVVSWTLTATHLLTLADLTASGGTGVLATDVTAHTLCQLRDFCTPDEGLALLDTITKAGNIFDFANPNLIQQLLQDNPYLQRAFPTWCVKDVWVWCNGPATKFLVYGAALPRS